MTVDKFTGTFLTDKFTVFEYKVSSAVSRNRISFNINTFPDSMVCISMHFIVSYGKVLIFIINNVASSRLLNQDMAALRVAEGQLSQHAVMPKLRPAAAFQILFR